VTIGFSALLKGFVLTIPFPLVVVLIDQSAISLSFQLILEPIEINEKVIVETSHGVLLSNSLHDVVSERAVFLVILGSLLRTKSLEYELTDALINRRPHRFVLVEKGPAGGPTLVKAARGKSVRPRSRS
jgi:hypothetical protein